MTASAQWRLNFTADSGGGYIIIGEITLRTGPGVAMPAGTPSASVVDFGSAANAIDGAYYTYWGAVASNYPATWSMTFGTAVDITDYDIVPFPSETYAPSAWTLEYFDGSTWVVADTQSGLTTGWTVPTARLFTVPVPPTGIDGTCLMQAPSVNGVLNGTNGACLLETMGANGTLAGPPRNDGEITLPLSAADGAIISTNTINGACTLPFPVANDGVFLGPVNGDLVLAGITAAGTHFIDGNNGTIALPLFDATATASTLLISGDAALAPIKLTTNGASSSWRLYILSANGSVMSLPEVEFRSIAYVPEAFPAGTASASGSLVAGRGPEKAIDGSVTSDWYSSDASGWWRFDYTAPHSVAQVKISTNGVGEPGQFLLQYWDNANWVTADVQMDEGGAWSLGTRYFNVGVQGHQIAPNDGTAAVNLPLFDGNGIAFATVPLTGALILPQLATADGLALAEVISDGDITLPPCDLAAWMATGTLSDGDVLLPLSLSAGSLESALRLRPLQLNAAALAGATGDFDGMLGLFDASGSMEPALAFPLPLVVAVMAPGDVGHGDAVLPMLRANGVAGITANAVLPALVLAGLARSGATAAGVMDLPSLALSGVLLQAGSGAGSCALPLPDVAGQITQTAFTAGAVLLPAPALDGVLLADNTLGAVLEVPLLHVDGRGFASVTGSALIRLPTLSMAGSMVATLAPALFAGLVLHTRTGALATYGNGGFNSLASFNGLLLAAGSSGIVALYGNTDAGLPIAATLASGSSEFKSEQMKRVLCGYAGYRSDARMELTLIAEGKREYVYALEPRASAALHASRVKFARGVEGRNWQWRLVNTDGAAFEIDTITLLADILKRKTG